MTEFCNSQVSQLNDQWALFLEVTKFFRRYICNEIAKDIYTDDLSE